MPLAAEHLESRAMLATTANLSGDISTFARIPVTFGSRPADYVGQFYWSGMTGDAAAVGLPPAFKSFCIEGLQSISPGSNTFDSLVPLTASTLLGSGRADQVTEFWRQYGPTASTGFTDNTDGAAFQLAIWEIINDGRPTAGQAAAALAGGTFKVAGTHLTAPAVARAAAWLNGTGTATVGGGAVALYALQSPTKQDQVVCVPVPSITIDATDAEADEVMTARDIPDTGRFRLSRSGDTSKDLLAKVQVSGTATYSAFAADDYTLDLVRTGLTGYFVTIPSGRAFVDIVCTPFQDGTNEDTETVTLSIAQFTGYTVGPRSQATVSILDAPDLSAASVAFRIDMDARPAARCWPVDPAERRLPQVPQDTLRTGEPYVFSLADIGTERTAGVTWELSYDIIQTIGDLAGAVTVTASSGSATGPSFPRTFAVDEERVATLFGTTTHDRWQVHFFIDANRNGRRDADESFTVGRFNEVLQDRKGIWLCRLEQEKKAHAGTIYNDVFGVTAFFDQLIATVKNVSFGRNSVGTANAIYGFVLDRIGVNDAENVGGGIDTIIHESVHALDDARNWPPGARPVFLDRVEGVGYTAAALLNRDKDLYLLKSIRTFESLLIDPGADETALRKGWKDCVVQLQYFAGHVDIDAAGTPRSGTAADVQAVKEDVGLWFNMTALMAAYQRRLDTRGVQMTLETTYVSGNDKWAIPNVFLE